MYRMVLLLNRVHYSNAEETDRVAYIYSAPTVTFITATTTTIISAAKYWHTVHDVFKLKLFGIVPVGITESVRSWMKWPNTSTELWKVMRK